MRGAFLQDCILPPLKYFISKHNLNFYSYSLMIEIIYIIPLKKAALWSSRHGHPDQQYYPLVDTKWNCKHMILETHKKSGLLSQRLKMIEK